MLIGGERSPIRVLIVDDNRDAAEVLGLLLGYWGFDLRIAHDGQEGLAAAQEFRPRFVLSDIQMPLMNGYEMTDLLRHDRMFEEVVFVGISANGDAERAKGVGFDYLLTKPVDPAVLKNIFERHRPVETVE